MDHKYLAFDLETAKVSVHPREWISDRPLGISCAATFSEGDKEPVLWYGRERQQEPAAQMTVSDARALVKFLDNRATAGYSIVTWNGIGFDFDVLAEESGMRSRCKSLALDHVDMMFHLLCQLGFGVSLNSAAQGMRLTRSSKRRTGSVIPKLWAAERYDDVFRHVGRDVRITLALATTCCERGFVRWITRWGTGRMVRLPNGWLKARAAQLLPDPPRVQSQGQWSRDRLTAWMRPLGQAPNRTE
jgi:hypothetical protein